MNTYLNASETGKEWTLDDVWNLQPGENPPWNPEGIALNPADFPSRQAFEAERDRMIDASGYRDLYEAWKRGRPGTYQYYQTEVAEKKIRNRNLLIAAAAAVAALFAFGG